MNTGTFTTSQEMIAGTLRDRRLNTAKNLTHGGLVHDKVRRESVLRNAKDVIAATRKPSIIEHLRNSVLINGEEKGKAKPPRRKRNKKGPSTLDIGHRLISIATAASIVMGGLFVTEQVIGIIDSAHASQLFDYFHR